MDDKRKAEETDREKRREEELEEGLEESFPASDPPAGTQPGAGGFEDKEKPGAAERR